MKRILLILAVLPFLLNSCKEDPYADFYVSDYTPETNEVIYFYNTSDDFSDLEWDFGDGTYSKSFNPSHYYTSAGIYRVTLTVYGKDGKVDLMFQEIEVLYPTTLEITVLEYYDKYPVPNASVILYPTLYDWENEINPIRDENGDVLEGFTDADGVVIFEGLNPVEYWVDVWHENHNNYLLAQDDENFIRTLPLERNVINTFIAYVDYVESSNKKDARESSRFKTSSVKRVHPDTENIKELVK